MPGRQILIADPDPATARLLAPALRQRGHSVSAVSSGSRALELCVLRVPDLVLFDVACPLLDSVTFRQILRANPRTEHVPVLLTGKTDARSPLSLRDGFLLKPFNVDEVLARLDQVLGRADAAQRAHRTDQGMEGTLGQLSIVDLLQVLGQNRKSGQLRIVGPRGSGLIRLADGQVLSAQGENTRGLKAFFRLIAWRDGNFSFVPGEPDIAEAAEIQKPVEELLLEGLRQSDELGAIREELPHPGARLVLRTAPPAAIEPGDPRTPPTLVAEILDLARTGATVGEVLERTKATDYQASQAMLQLLSREIIAPAPGDLSARALPKQLVTPGVAHALRASLGNGRTDGSRPRGKIVLLGEPGPLIAFAEHLSAVPGSGIFREELRWPAGPFGSIGRLDVTEDLAFDLVVLPTGEAARPLWLPFSARAVGALAIDSPAARTSALTLLSFLAGALDLPIVWVGPTSVPPELTQVGPRLSATAEGPFEALRTLLANASRRRRAGGGWVST